MEAVSNNNLESQSLIQYTHLQKKGKFFHDNTTYIKITRIALDILAISAIVVGISSTSISIGLIIAGTLTIALVEIIYFALSFFGYLSVDKSDRPFKTGSFEDSRLYYKDGIPRLDIKAATPYKAGYAHGILAGEGILTMFKKILLLVKFTSEGKKLEKIIAKNEAKLLTITPAKYLEELKGVVAGVNKVKNKSFLGRRLRDVEVSHLLALHYMSSLGNLDNSDAKATPSLVACTTILEKKEGQVTVGRTLDWPSLGTFGKTSLVKTQKIGDGPEIKDVTFAGNVGTVTGVNKDTNLFVAMNVSTVSHGHPTENELSTPIAPLFYNRYVLENAKTVDEAKSMHIESPYKPDGTYHLTVADKSDGAAIHFYQASEAGDASIREIQKDRLITLNSRYSDQTIVGEMFYSEQRRHNANLMLNKTGSDRLSHMKNVLAAPYVNNELTLHSVIYHDGALHITKPDNSFAASNKWVKI